MYAVRYKPIAKSQMNLTTLTTRKPCYRKDDRAMRPIYGCLENFSGVTGYAYAYFSRNC